MKSSEYTARDRFPTPERRPGSGQSSFLACRRYTQRATDYFEVLFKNVAGDVYHA